MTGFVLKLVPDEATATLLADILTKLARLETLMGVVDDKITELAAVVAEKGTVIESAIALMDGLFDQLMAAIANNSGNSAAQVAAIQAVIDASVAQKTVLADKVLENTPVVGGATPV